MTSFDITKIFDYIDPAMVIVIFALYVVGMLFKNIPNVPDWIIPFALLVIAVILAIGVMGFGIDAIIQGILVCGIVVLAHQLIKQTINRNEE